MNEESIGLLQACDSGTKTGMNSIRAVLDKVQDTELLRLLTHSMETHEKLGKEIMDLLETARQEGRDPSAMARIGAWFKINMELLMEPTDSTVADLITDGCNMGVKQISVYFNRYPNADQKVKAIADRLRIEEEQLGQQLRLYL